MSLALHYCMGMYITAQGCRLRNDLYCVEWDVKLYYTIPYHTLCLFNGNSFVGSLALVKVCALLSASLVL